MWIQLIGAFWAGYIAGFLSSSYIVKRFMSENEIDRMRLESTVDRLTAELRLAQSRMKQTDVDDMDSFQ